MTNDAPQAAGCSEKLQPTPRNLYDFAQLVTQLPDGVDDDERVLAVIQRGNTIAHRLDQLERELAIANEQISDATGSYLEAEATAQSAIDERNAARKEAFDLAVENESLRSARAATIEECAKVCDERASYWADQDAKWEQEVEAARCANALRSLASRSEREGKG